MFQKLLANKHLRLRDSRLSSVRLSGTVSVSDYTLCMRSVGLAEKVMSLTFRRNVNLHVPRCTCGKRKRVLTSIVHIPKKSLMIHWFCRQHVTWSKGQQRSHTSYIIQALRYPQLFLVHWYFFTNDVILGFAWLAKISFSFRSLNLLQ